MSPACLSGITCQDRNILDLKKSKSSSTAGQSLFWEHVDKNIPETVSFCSASLILDQTREPNFPSLISHLNFSKSAR
jgi:hypothetical protein